MMRILTGLNKYPIEISERRIATRRSTLRVEPLGFAKDKRTRSHDAHWDTAEHPGQLGAGRLRY